MSRITFVAGTNMNVNNVQCTAARTDNPLVGSEDVFLWQYISQKSDEYKCVQSNAFHVQFCRGVLISCEPAFVCAVSLALLRTKASSFFAYCREISQSYRTSITLRQRSVWKRYKMALAATLCRQLCAFYRPCLFSQISRPVASQASSDVHTKENESTERTRSSEHVKGNPGGDTDNLLPSEEKGEEDEYEPELVDMWNKDAPAGPEWNGPRGYEPTRHGDWSKNGRVSDF